MISLLVVQVAQTSSHEPLNSIIPLHAHAGPTPSIQPGEQPEPGHTKVNPLEHSAVLPLQVGVVFPLDEA